VLRLETNLRVFSLPLADLSIGQPSCTSFDQLDVWRLIIFPPLGHPSVVNAQTTSNGNGMSGAFVRIPYQIFQLRYIAR
jgi:hypothetical protein